MQNMKSYSRCSEQATSLQQQVPAESFAEILTQRNEEHRAFGTNLTVSSLEESLEECEYGYVTHCEKNRETPQKWLELR